MAVDCVAAAQQGSGLGLQQGEAAYLLHHLKCLPGSLHCTSWLLLPQQTERLAHESIDERLSAPRIQVAHLCMRLQHHASNLAFSLSEASQEQGCGFNLTSWTG